MFIVRLIPKRVAERLKAYRLENRDPKGPEFESSRFRY